MRSYEVAVTAAAPLARVWAALVDVTDWPRWSPSYVYVRRLDDGPLRVGSTARVKQPGLAVSTYEVTELTPEHLFTWATSASGVRTVARHRLESETADSTKIALDVTQSGLAAGLIGTLLGGRIRRYIELEAAGIKAAAEAAPKASS